MMDSTEKKKTSASSWMITLPVAAAAVAYVMLFFLPGSKAIGELNKQIAEKEQYVQTAGGMSTSLDIAQKELQRVREYDQQWTEHVPKQRELASLFGKINQAAKDAGTITTRFDPEPIVQHACLREIPLSMGCTGTYSQVFDFLRRLESMPQSIWVNSVRIDKADQTKKDISCELSLVVFAGNLDDSDYANNSD